MSRVVSKAVERRMRQLINSFNRHFGKAIPVPEDVSDYRDYDNEHSGGSPYHSSKVLGHSYTHLKALHEYLTKALQHVDHPGASRDLEILKRRHLEPAMEHIRKSHDRHHGDTADLDDVVDEIEGGGSDYVS